MANQIQEAVWGALKTKTEVTAHVPHAAQEFIGLAHGLDPSCSEHQSIQVNVVYIQGCRAQNGDRRRAIGTQVDAVGEAAWLDVDIYLYDGVYGGTYEEVDVTDRGKRRPWDQEQVFLICTVDEVASSVQYTLPPTTSTAMPLGPPAAVPNPVTRLINDI